MWLDDPFWLNAARWTVRLADSYRYVLSPAEFNGLTPNCLPLEFAHLMPPVDVAVVMPKIDVDRLSLAWLRRLRQFCPLHVDEVFAVLASQRHPSIVPAPDEHLHHLGLLWDQLDLALGPHPARRTGVDAMMSYGKTDGPFGLVISATQTGNAGERLMVAGAVEILRARWPDLAWIVTNTDVDRSLVQRAACVVLGPGGYLYDVSAASGQADLMNVAAYCKFGFLAGEYGKPLLGLGVGDQGLVTVLGRQFVAGALTNASLMVTRHRETAALLLNDLGFPGPLLAAPDLSVALARRIRGAAKKPNETPRLTVTLCGTFSLHPEVGAVILKSLLQARQHADMALQIVLQAKEDADWLREHGPAFLSALGDIPVIDAREADPDTFIKAISSSGVLITTRFHAMMAGLMAGAETVVLGRRGDKRHRVLAGLGCDAASFIDIEKVPAPEMAQIIGRVLGSVGQGGRKSSPFDPEALDRVRHMLAAVALPMIG
jgi:polysaccharide pyruvyl transferase WcaK-like protein